MSESNRPALNDEQWEELLEQVGRHFNEVTLSRGYQYFKQQFVESLRITAEDRVVQGKVTGTETYQVVLNLNRFASSTCTCPVRSNCKHLAAVIMELADRLGYPASQVVNARMYQKRVQTAVPAQSALQQLPQLDVAGWHAFWEEATSFVKPAYDPGKYTEMLRHQLQRLSPRSIPFTAVDWHYYELHQHLFVLRKLKELDAQGQASHYTAFALQRMYEDVQHTLRQQSAAFNLTLSTERLTQTLRYMRQQIAEEPGLRMRDYGLYMALWKALIASRPEAEGWVSQELDELEQLPGESLSFPLQALKAFHYLQQSRIEEAWAALEASDSFTQAPASLFLPFLNHLSASRNWKALVDWLSRMRPQFQHLRGQEFQVYMAFWKEAAVHRPEVEEPMLDFLRGMLPLSTPFIENWLYEQHRWKPWLEIQLWLGRDPLQYRVSVLQPIEKEAPELLVPYYHQGIEFYVSQKNRQNYKLAVKLLKRLFKIYKKLKRIDRWEGFLDGFLDGHNRLRALHEEIKKGKLAE